MLNEPCLCRCAPHVKGDDVWMPQGRPQMGCGNNARRWARFYHEYRLLACCCKGKHSAATLHHKQLRFESLFAESGLNALEIACNDGSNAGINHCGTRPKILSELWRDLARKGNDDLWQCFPQDCTRPLLMVWVDVGMKKAEGNGFDIRFAKQCGDIL